MFESLFNKIEERRSVVFNVSFEQISHLIVCWSGNIQQQIKYVLLIYWFCTVVKSTAVLNFYTETFIHSKLAIQTPLQNKGVFIVNFEHVQYVNQ